MSRREKYLLDTNICVHLLRGRYSVDKAIDRAGVSNCAISEITKAELLFGENLVKMKTGRDSGGKLNEFLSLLEVVPISDAIEQYASEKARLSLSRLTIEDFDLLIACSAVSLGAILVTESISHMGRVSGVKIENWVKR